MRKSLIAILCGTAGLIVGLLIANTSAATGTTYAEDRVNPAW
jgi:hypothetical protein